MLKDLFTSHSPLTFSLYLCLPSPQLWASELAQSEQRGGRAGNGQTHRGGEGSVNLWSLGLVDAL